MTTMVDNEIPLLGGNNGDDGGRNGMILKLGGFALGVGSITAAVLTFNGKLPWDDKNNERGIFVVKLGLVIVIPLVVFGLCHCRYAMTTAPGNSTPAPAQVVTSTDSTNNASTSSDTAKPEEKEELEGDESVMANV